MTAYYSEHDAKAAAWLRELIRRNLIAPGWVDERSILDVRPSDLDGFTQHHFFAGIGVWSYALRRAGWSDDEPVWTGSCPCQPFSAAGKRAGTADERHLWPAFFHLIGLCRPDVGFGEQVESKDGRAWLDTVQTDMEGLDYAFGAVAAPAAGFGAPHARHRLYWVADTQHTKRGAIYGPVEDERDGNDAGREETHGIAGACGAIRELAHTSDSGHRGIGNDAAGRREPCSNDPTRVALGDAEREGLEIEQRERRTLRGTSGTTAGQTFERASPDPCNGFWADADWLYCRDGKYRPVEPGTPPLAHGAPARVGRLRGYGNGLVAPQAIAFIEAYCELAR